MPARAARAVAVADRCAHRSAQRRRAHGRPPEDGERRGPGDAVDRQAAERLRAPDGRGGAAAEPAVDRAAREAVALGARTAARRRPSRGGRCAADDCRRVAPERSERAARARAHDAVDGESGAGLQPAHTGSGLRPGEPVDGAAVDPVRSQRDLERRDARVGGLRGRRCTQARRATTADIHVRTDDNVPDVRALTTDSSRAGRVPCSSVTTRRVLVPVACALAVAAASVLVVAPAPSYDPWAWLLWGREVAGLELEPRGRRSSRCRSRCARCCRAARRGRAGGVGDRRADRRADRAVAGVPAGRELAGGRGRGVPRGGRRGLLRRLPRLRGRRRGDRLDDRPGAGGGGRLARGAAARGAGVRRGLRAAARRGVAVPARRGRGALAARPRTGRCWSPARSPCPRCGSCPEWLGSGDAPALGATGRGCRTPASRATEAVPAWPALREAARCRCGRCGLGALRGAAARALGRSLSRAGVDRARRRDGAGRLLGRAALLAAGGALLAIAGAAAVAIGAAARRGARSGWRSRSSRLAVALGPSSTGSTTCAASRRGSGAWRRTSSG